MNNVQQSRTFPFRIRYIIDFNLASEKKLDNGIFTCGIFIDLEKAFDTVNHNILLSKLDHYGIRDNALKWLTSYLTNRKQFVKLIGSQSKHGNICCGVPQGSILGPLLFTLITCLKQSLLAKCTTLLMIQIFSLAIKVENGELMTKILNQ